MARPTMQEKLTRALRGAAWSQEHLQGDQLDASTRELLQDNLEQHLKDAKRLQGRLRQQEVR